MYRNTAASTFSNSQMRFILCKDRIKKGIVKKNNIIYISGLAYLRIFLRISLTSSNLRPMFSRRYML